MVSMLEEIEGIISLPKQAYHVFYRIGSNTRKESGETFSRVYEDSVNNADMAAEVVRKKYPGLQKEALRFGLFQRLEYLLHIPVSRMKKENQEYRKICRSVKKSWKEILTNPFLTKKNNAYLLLFAVAPKRIRQIHGWKKKVGR